MNRMTHFVAACVAVLAWTSALVLTLAPAASGAAPCEQRVIDDWSADGQIDRTYKLHCYEDAIAALPLSLRDYSDLADVIRRSQSNAVIDPDARPQGLAATPVVNESANRAIPPPLLLLGGVALTLLALGGLTLLYGRLTSGRRDVAR
jgi:hypothetical protein